ncbi:MAG: T9SS type A sorting domain-containing protein [Bacteroidales bacterium]|nr:T9SS type A sorting domain-containing protein [Bacteroidales bacterium]
MKRKLTILTCFIALCSFAFGQNHWTPNKTSQNGLTMTVVATVSIDGTEQTSSDLEVGVFDGEIVRGSARLEWYDILNRSIVRLNIYGDAGDNMTVKLYDHNTDTELDYISNNIITFVENGSLGKPSAPYQINFNRPVVNVAKIGDVEYTSLQEAENAAKDGETIVLLEDIVLDGMVTFFNSANPRMLTLDMNNKTITMSDDWDNTTAKSAFWVCDGLTITGNGTINAAPANEAAVYAIIVGHRTAGTTDGSAGTLVIENGTFYGNDASVISVTNGIATINGGTFESPGEFDLNCIDDMYVAGKANITVKGGTFVGFNPENNAAEGANTNFCAEGYAALPNLDGNFIVGTKPTATVNNLGMTTVAAGDYMVYGGGTNTEDMPLSFVMQFLADQDAEDMATSPFADWYGDFVITFTGIENGSFTADGCYLAGHYGSFGWVKIPVDGMTINEEQRYPVMLGVGMGQKYDYICSSVQDFMCALYLTPEILAANPNIQVNLELAIVDNSQGSDAATSALVNNTNVYEVVDYDYDAIDFNMNFVARIGDKGYETLAKAVEAAQPNETIELINNAEGSGIVINKSLTIDFGGFTYTFVEHGVGDTQTKSNGFQIKKDNNVTLMNGTLNVDKDWKEKFYILIQNYSNLTVEDMKLDGTNLDMWSATDGDSYVISNNSGNVNITGNTKIIANDYSSVTPSKAFAFDACDQTSKGYALPVVTVNTTGDIKGAVEVSATLNIEALGEGSEISYISIDGKGQLFHNGLTTTIKKHITGDPVPEDNSEYVGGWYTISSPIGTVNHTDVVGLLNENGTHDLYRYNEANAMWENVKNTEHSDFTTLEAGRGYIYANTADTELSFTGTLNTAAVKQQLSASHTELTGFNLIGNPFTYDIALENITGAELASGFYTLTKEGAWGASISSIGACQGALVKTTAASEITINPAAASKRTASENNGALAITVSNAKYSDVAYVSFNEGIGLDKINHRNANIPMVYVPVNGKNFAIATMSQDVNEIPVSFKASTMGQYTISVEAVDCEFNEMYLTDRMTGEKVNLLLEDYTFVATSNDNANRFVISFATTMPESVAENFIYINNGNMIINNIEGNAVVRVLDVLGRPVAEYNVTESANISTATLSSGVYLIQMYDNNGVKVQKVVVE